MVSCAYHLIKRDFIMNHDYDDLINDLSEIKDFIKGCPTLSGVIRDDLFEVIKTQLGAMIENDLPGPLNPFYNLVMREDKNNQYEKLKLIENCLEVLYRYPIAGREKKKIISQLNSTDRIQCLEKLFEISVLAYLLEKFHGSNPDIFPITHGKRDVELSIEPVKRKVYFEATILAESDQDKRQFDDLLLKKIDPQFQALDTDYHARRFSRKVDLKGEQFLPANPNVLFISIFGFQPNSFIVDKALRMRQVNNVGLIVVFNRFKFQRIVQEGCDSECLLSTKELSLLENTLTDNDFPNLVYP